MSAHDRLCVTVETSVEKLSALIMAVDCDRVTYAELDAQLTDIRDALRAAHESAVADSERRKTETSNRTNLHEWE